MHRDVTHAPHWPRKSAQPREIARRSRDQERGRVIMTLYKPIVASVVVSLMVAGLAVAQDPTKRPPAPAAPAPAASTPAGTVPAAAAPASGVPVGPEYKIGIDDVLDIAVWNNTTVSRTVPVRPDGKITLPLINEVQAAGLTPTQLRAAIMAKLVEYMPTPELSVIVREVHSNKISVLGEVRKAGRYEITQRATVLDAGALAGRCGRAQWRAQWPRRGRCPPRQGRRCRDTPWSLAPAVERRRRAGSAHP